MTPIIVRALGLGLAALAAAQQGTARPPVPPTTTPPVTSPLPTAKPSTPESVTRGNISPRAPRATASVAGRVVDSTGRPVPRAIVRAIGESTMRTTVADSRGQFAIEGIVPGEVVVRAEKFGLISGGFGQRRPTGLPLPLSLAATEAVSDMRIELFTTAVITGQVADEGRAPIVGARVVALRRQFTNGEWTFREASSDATDDEGRYRIWGLEPGEYLVIVPVTSATMPEVVDLSYVSMHDASRAPSVDAIDGIYPTQFYPATSRSLLAFPIHLTPSQVQYAVDFVLVPTPAHRVSGRLTATFPLQPRYELRLVDVDGDTRTGFDAATTISSRDGTFAFERVPTGRYRIEVNDMLPAPGLPLVSIEGGVPPDPPAANHFGRLEVIVSDDDVTGLEVRLRPTTSLSGRVSVETSDGERDLEPDERPTIWVEPAEPGASPARMATFSQGGSYEAEGLVPGRYWLRIVPSDRGGVTFKTFWEAGAPRPDVPIDVGEFMKFMEVRMTDRPTEIIGTVRESALKVSSGATVIAMPVPPQRDLAWLPNRMHVTRASSAGVFTITGLPPGDYFIVAIDDAVAEGWQDPAMLAALRPLATRITLRDEQSITMELKFSAYKR